MYNARVMAKWDNSKFSKKEIRELEKNPIIPKDEDTVSCPCGKFRGKVKELENDCGELKCPVCGNFNLIRGMLYVRILQAAEG